MVRVWGGNSFVGNGTFWQGVMNIWAKKKIILENGEFGGNWIAAWCTSCLIICFLFNYFFCSYNLQYPWAVIFIIRKQLFIRNEFGNHPRHVND